MQIFGVGKCRCHTALCSWSFTSPMPKGGAFQNVGCRWWFYDRWRGRLWPCKYIISKNVVDLTYQEGSLTNSVQFWKHLLTDFYFNSYWTGHMSRRLQYTCLNTYDLATDCFNSVTTMTTTVCSAIPLYCVCHGPVLLSMQLMSAQLWIVMIHVCTCVS